MIKDGDFTDEQLLLTPVQAAKVLGLSRSTLYELMRAGEIHPVHISRCCRISWAELERYVVRLDAAAAGAKLDDKPRGKTERRWRRVATPSGERKVFAVEAPTSSDGSAA